MSAIHVQLQDLILPDFFHNNPKFMVYLIYSLTLSTFSFENAVFTSMILMAEANQISNNYKLSSFYIH